MSIDYAKEELWQAVHGLATGDRSIQERLAGAAMYLIRIEPDDLPKGLRQELDAIRHDLTKETAAADEGTIAATTRRLTSDQGAKLAERILHLFTELLVGS